MINKLKIKFGSSPSKPPLEVDTTPITVFVGPNNSGKSKVLIEIQSFCNNGNISTTDVILNGLDFAPLPDPDGEINKHTLAPKPNELVQPGHIIYGKGTWRNQVHRGNLLTFLSDTSGQRQNFCGYYASFNTIRIDGGSRINLIQPQPTGDLQAHPNNSLGVLFKDNSKRSEVRRIIFDAFKKYFVIDPTNSGQLRIRLSDTAPADEIQERGLHEDAIEFHRKAVEITLASDGVKAFTGIITTLVAGDPKIILIDEPEAFLHPSLASNLGKEVSNSVNGTFKNLFVSTHSANFLMGCIQSGVPINIIRLTYSNNIPTARILPGDKVLKLMRHPLLRSIGVLNGLFYEYVIVTEADSDRAFYQEINERLLADSGKGIPNCLFLNAQNKQTIHEIVRPLREMGIPCAAIVDVDVVKEGGTVWTNLLSSACVPEVTIIATGTSRGQIMSKFNAKVEADSKPINFKIKGGVDVLDAGDREACNNLFDQLDDYGIFAVRKGELESWLKPLTATGHGSDWLIEIFEQLGEDPAATSYVRPGTDDVWAFVEKIKTWFTTPVRKGIPE